MPFRRRHSLVALVVLAGCGGGTPDREQPAVAPSQAAAPAATSDHPKPCRDTVKAIVGGSATTRVTRVSPGMATCVYSTSGQRIDVQVDVNPQAGFRFMRAVVERGQNADWTHTPSKAPVLQHGVTSEADGGADWFPADDELLATDGKQLISVHFVKSPLKRRAELALAKQMAKSQLTS